MERELVIGTGNRERSALKNPGEPGPWKCRHGNERVEMKRMKMKAENGKADETLHISCHVLHFFTPL